MCCQGYGRQPPQSLAPGWTGTPHTAGWPCHCTARRHSSQLECKLQRGGGAGEEGQGRRGRGGGAGEEGQGRRGRGGGAREEGQGRRGREEGQGRGNTGRDITVTKLIKAW